MTKLAKTELDEILWVGSTAIAAVAERWIQGRGGGGGRSGGVRLLGGKRPLGVLIHSDGATRALDIEDGAVTLAEFDRRYPGARSEFERRLGG